MVALRMHAGAFEHVFMSVVSVVSVVYLRACMREGGWWGDKGQGQLLCQAIKPALQVCMQK